MNGDDVTVIFKEWLTRVGVPQSQAARRLGITSVYLNRILQGTSKPSDELLERMAAFTERLKATGLRAV